MRYGFATGFATPMRDSVDNVLVENIKHIGFDFVEFPLTLLSQLSIDAFEDLLKLLKLLKLDADCVCNMFPASMRLTGPGRDFAAAKRYMDHVLPRLKLLGTRKIVFGSSGARNLPEGTDALAGYTQIVDLVSTVILPLLEEYDMVLCMEPIGRYEANFINQLKDGMKVVTAIHHPRVRLLADSVHLLYENEDARELRRFQDHLHHVHICENERKLPLGKATPQLDLILKTLGDIGYDGTLSFEPTPHTPEEMAEALKLVKAYYR